MCLGSEMCVYTYMHRQGKKGSCICSLLAPRVAQNILSTLKHAWWWEREGSSSSHPWTQLWRECVVVGILLLLFSFQQPRASRCIKKHQLSQDCSRTTASTQQQQEQSTFFFTSQWWGEGFVCAQNTCILHQNFRKMQATSCLAKRQKKLKQNNRRPAQNFL